MVRQFRRCVQAANSKNVLTACTSNLTSATRTYANTSGDRPQDGSYKGKSRALPPAEPDQIFAPSKPHAKIKQFLPPGLRHLSSTSGGGPARLGMSSEADLGRHFYLNKVLEQWAAKPATRMTLRQLIFFGRTLGRDREKILKSANYVRQELPVRIAHRIRDLQALPFVVMTNQRLEDVYQKYWSAFETFRRFPHIKTLDDNEKFCNLLRGLLDDHLTIIPSLTIGIVESSHHLQPQQLDKFMERMLRSRISRRVLAEQHIALSEALDDPFHFFNEPDRRQEEEEEHDDSVGDHVGIIYTRLSVASVVNKGIKLLTQMFVNVQGIAPDRIPKVVVDGDLGARFAYIPEHLEYIVFELLKNAIRATIRRHTGDNDVGSVRVTVVEGPPEEDLIIRMSDTGGGLPDLISQLQGSRRLLGSSNASSRQAEKQRPSSAATQSPQSADAQATEPSASRLSEEQYPIQPNPFPDTGHIGGYPPRGSWARNHPESDSLPVTLQDDVFAPGHQQSTTSSQFSAPVHVPADPISFYADSWASEASASSDSMPGSFRMGGDTEGASSFASFTPPIRGGVGSAGGVGGSLPPNEFGTVGTSTTRIDSDGGYHDPLIDALCSFSNVRRRLELEEQAVRVAHTRSRTQQTTAHSSTDSSTPDSPSAFYGLPNLFGAGLAGSTAPPLQSEAGLGTRHRFDALKSIEKFKGTVTEQVTHTPSSRHNTTVTTDSARDSSSATADVARGVAAKFEAVEGTGPAALHTVQVETGLGLPMAKVYCDFFGGSLSFRSLDGLSTDIYVRLPKLGIKKETIEEIVL